MFEYGISAKMAGAAEGDFSGCEAGGGAAGAYGRRHRPARRNADRGAVTHDGSIGMTVPSRKLTTKMHNGQLELAGSLSEMTLNLPPQPETRPCAQFFCEGGEHEAVTARNSIWLTSDSGRANAASVR
jgi:hypothetical protein